MDPLPAALALAAARWLRTSPKIRRRRTSRDFTHVRL